MNAREKHAQNVALLQEFLANRPDLKELVELLELVKDSANVTATLSIGQALSPDTFMSLLTSRLENPRIHFTTVDSSPLVLIQGKKVGFTALSLNLDKTEVVTITAEDCPTWVKYIVRLIHAGSEYELSFLIKNT